MTECVKAKSFSEIVILTIEFCFRSIHFQRYPCFFQDFQFNWIHNYSRFLYNVVYFFLKQPFWPIFLYGGDNLLKYILMPIGMDFQVTAVVAASHAGCMIIYSRPVRRQYLGPGPDLCDQSPYLFIQVPDVHVLDLICSLQVMFRPIIRPNL